MVLFTQGTRHPPSPTNALNALLPQQMLTLQSPLQRHRLVYNLLDNEFQQGLHALNIMARTPAEMEARKAVSA